MNYEEEKKKRVGSGRGWIKKRLTRNGRKRRRRTMANGMWKNRSGGRGMS